MDSPRSCAASSAAATCASRCDRARGLERRLLVEQTGEVGAVDVAHRDVELPVGLAGVVDREDVRVIERGRQLALDEEPLAEALVGRQFRREQLQRDLRFSRSCSAR